MSAFSASVPALADEELLLNCKALAFFQPIGSVKTRSVVGVEALARGLDASGCVISPGQLFAEAAELGVAGPWEMLCRENALATFARAFPHHDSLLLFVNINLASSDGHKDAAHLLETAQRHALSPNEIVVEVLESRFDDAQRLASILNQFRELGFLLALDDVGAGHSNLDRIPLIRPDLLKVDRELVEHLDTNSYKQGVFKAVVDLGRRIGALVVAEGVETEQETLTALELGADLLQGFAISRPQPPDDAACQSSRRDSADASGPIQGTHGAKDNQAASQASAIQCADRYAAMRSDLFAKRRLHGGSQTSSPEIL